MPDINIQCPECKSVLSSLTCRCGKVYQRVNGVLRFISDSVDPGFDLRWKNHPKPQATTQGIFETKTGWHGTDLRDKLVLDAGCGCGRFSEIVAGYGAYVIGVDGSNHGPEAAAALVPQGVFIQADLLNLPFQDATFDAIFSIGVLHHTSNPQAAFNELVRVLKPGGELAVWLYITPGCDEHGKVVSPTIVRAAEFLHAITKACPPQKLHEACEAYVVDLRDLYRGEWGPLQQVLRISSSVDDEECISDTFDWHIPTYRSGHSIREIKRWYTQAGLDVSWVGNFAVSMRGCK